jgi:hypothetical protein
MSKQYPGGLITKTPVIPSGPYETSRASGIWTLDQQAVYAEQGIWPTAGVPGPDAQFNYVTMLLHGDGTNGAQNNTFVDSGLGFSVTRNGNTTQGSFSPYGSNWSNYLNNESANNSYLSVASNAAFAYGTANFTVECWVFMTATPANDNGIIEQRPASTNGNYFLLGVSSSNQLFVYVNSAYRIGPSAGTVMTVNAWNHVAYSRSSGTATLYLNGVSIGSWSDSINYGNQPVGIGFQAFASLGLKYFAGYISNVRIVKGTAVYTAGFTPSTTPLTAITNTSLLTCQSNRFVDNSASPLTITVNGTPSVQRFNPFGTATAYSTAVIGGSGYFDGTGDNLSVAANSSNLGTGDFNITFWVYFTSDSGSSVPATNNYNGGSFTNGWYFFGSSGTTMSFGLGDATGTNAISGALSGINAWHYIEATRSGSTLSLYVDGVLAQSKTNTNSGTVSGNVTRIGARYDGTALYFPGYITDFKVVLGTAGNTSNYTPPTAPAAATGANFLLSMQNGAIFDNAMMNDLETAGNAQISTSVKKYGTGSLAFDGNGDYLKLPYTPDLNFTGNFTVECWVNLTSKVTNFPTIINNYSTYTTNGGFAIFASHNSGTSGKYNVSFNGSFPVINSTTSISYGSWQHIALVRSGSTLTLYVDGVANGTSTQTANVVGTANNWWIGTAGDDLTNGYLNGYIDDLRITKGYARYTANFTPPTAAFQNIGPN